MLSDNWHPSWRARVDGRPVPVVRANLVMRAVPVPAGRHTVVLEFVPRTFYVGAAISARATSVLLFLGLRGLPRRRAASGCT